MANITIIGSGNIGKDLKRQVEEKGHKVIAQAKRDFVRFGNGRGGAHIHSVGDTDEILNALDPIMPKTDAVMLTIPNGNKGVDELQYMNAFRGKHIITCAKAAHAYQYERVLALGQPIGRRAIVGGGTDMLEGLRRRQLQNDGVLLDAVVNGTLNHIWHAVQSGGPPFGAIDDAGRLGYAEPGNKDYVKVLNGEIDDLCMKAAILHNIVLSDGRNFLTPDDFKVCYLEDEEDIHRLSSRNVRYRFILTFASVNDYDARPEGERGSLRATCGRWKVYGNFHNVAAETHWFDWLREAGGVMNGWRIYPRSKDGPYSFVGPGAGPETTAAAMMRDLHDLLAA